MAEPRRCHRGTGALARALALGLGLALLAGGVAAQPAPPDAPAAPSPALRAAPFAQPTASDPALEARMLAITGELRCLVCQNQTIADSHADLAADLRQQVREMLRKGMNEADIRAYMTARYGDFILYRPPLKATTVALWLGPALLMAVALGSLVRVILRRCRLADDLFEPDPVDDDADAPTTGAAAPRTEATS